MLAATLIRTGTGHREVTAPIASRTSSARRGIDWRTRALITARFISTCGGGFGRVALSFGVLVLPGTSGADLSTVLACQTVPQVALLLVSGAIADRVSRVRLMVAAEVLAAAAWGAFAVLVAGQSTQLWLLCVTAAVSGAASALFTPAMAGVLPSLVPAADVQRVNATVRVGQNLALLLGVAFSGVVVASLGAAFALVLNAGSFALSALLTAAVKVPVVQRRASSLVQDLRTGAATFFSRQWIWVVVAQYTVVLSAVQATTGVLGPLAALHGLGGARSWSAIAAGQALGALAGAWAARRATARRPILAAVLLTFVLALPMILLAVQAPVLVCAVGMFISGVVNDVIIVVWQTTVQTDVEPEMLSRISSYDFLGSLCLAPLGIYAAGPVSAAVGVHETLLLCAGLVITASLLALTAPQVRNLRTS